MLLLLPGSLSKEQQQTVNCESLHALYRQQPQHGHVRYILWILKKEEIKNSAVTMTSYISREGVETK